VRVGAAAVEGRVVQLPVALSHSGCPILRGFLRRVGGRLIAPLGFAFHAACPRNEIFPQLSFTALAPTRRDDRSDNGASSPAFRLHYHTVGAPSFACFLRRVGGRLIAPMGFTPRVPETKSSPNPHSPALAQTRREDRSDNCSSANPQVSPSDLASPDCGAYSAVSPPASSLSKH
jgi:hypothetical protein